MKSRNVKKAQDRLDEVQTAKAKNLNKQREVQKIIDDENEKVKNVKEAAEVKVKATGRGGSEEKILRRP